MKKHDLAAIGILATWMVWGSHLAAEEIPVGKQFEEVKALVKFNDTDEQVVRDVKINVAEYTDRLQQAIVNSESQTLRLCLRQPPEMLGPISRVAGLAEKLAALNTAAKMQQLNIRKVREAQFGALMKRAETLLPVARKPEELDVLLAGLAICTGVPGEERDPFAAGFADSQGFPPGTDIVRSWQDYLTAREAGKTEECRQSLHEVVKYLANYPVVPRSLVLRMINELPPDEQTPDRAQKDSAALEGIAARLAETGDAATALAELQKLRVSESSFAESLVRALQKLETLRRNQTSMTENELTRVLVRDLNSDHVLLARARDVILLPTLARSYGVEAPDPRTTSSAEFLDSIAREAADHKDWLRLAKAIESIERLDKERYVNSGNSDPKIIQLIQMGMAAEVHNDLEAAIEAYTTASTLTGHYVSSIVPYEMLVALRAKAPEKAALALGSLNQKKINIETKREAIEREVRNEISLEMRRRYDRLPVEEMAAIKSATEQRLTEALNARLPKTKRNPPGKIRPQEKAGPEKKGKTGPQTAPNDVKPDEGASKFSPSESASGPDATLSNMLIRVI